MANLSRRVLNASEVSGFPNGAQSPVKAGLIGLPPPPPPQDQNPVPMIAKTTNNSFFILLLNLVSPSDYGDGFPLLAHKSSASTNYWATFTDSSVSLHRVPGQALSLPVSASRLLAENQSHKLPDNPRASAVIVPFTNHELPFVTPTH